MEKIVKGVKTRGEVLQTSLHRLVFATVVLYVLMLVVGYYVYQLSASNTDGLCAFRNDTLARIEQSENYLRDHPFGTKAIPRNVLEISIANAKRTADALSGVKCPPPPQFNPEEAPEGAP
jgi:hypothetical protein